MNKTKAVTKYTISDKPLITTAQFLHIAQRTPKEHIYSRPAKGGGMWSYVTGVYVKKVLNYAFGWDWSFEVKDKIINDEQVIVLGRLSAMGGKIVKEQWGRADIKYRKQYKTGDPKIALDLGNDIKGATTDALKKCASELGIASDIYGKEEFKEIKREQFISLESESINLSEEEERKIGGCKDLDELAVVCKDMLEIKGKEYRTLILTKYNEQKAKIESEAK